MIIYLLLQVYRLPTCMRKDNCCVTSAYISPHILWIYSQENYALIRDNCGGGDFILHKEIERVTLPLSIHFFFFENETLYESLFKRKKNLKTNFIICNINACINSHKQGFFPVSAAVNR